MSEPEPRAPGEEPALAKPQTAGSLVRQIGPLLLSVPLLTLLTGMLFPLLLLIASQVLFPYCANGSLLRRPESGLVGSEWIGQKFVGPGYFHCRPSAAGYDGLTSGGTNLATTNPKLRADIRQRAEVYRLGNGLSRETLIPVDAVTCSGSGLDPHISPENAALQIGRVARQRHLSEQAVRRLVAEHTHGPQLGFLGAPRVAVLPLNLALDHTAPLRSSP
jgi:K+-transporting ATPase ATPase C chain